jgi:hypothetical protein
MGWAKKIIWRGKREMAGGPYKHRKDKDARHRDQVVLGLRVCGPLSCIKTRPGRILDFGDGRCHEKASLNAVSLGRVGGLVSGSGV